MNEFDFKNKKLLVLGGTSASYEVVKEAQKLGAYVIVTDQDETGVSKEIANESVQISTVDFDLLSSLVKEKGIDGVFCGPSEFNLKNAIVLSEKTGLPFYCTLDQWDQCSNKRTFKDLCRKFGVPCIPEYEVSVPPTKEELNQIKYPVIIKPSDGCSSKGISVCRNKEELIQAIPEALRYSSDHRILVEKLITNDYGFGCRYIASDGDIMLSACNDRYTVDPAGGKAMISACAIFPSKKIDSFIKDINPKIIEMFKSIGIQNGTMFMQALVDDDGEIYFHEMGLRLSGGLIYKMYQQTCGFSDLAMMIRLMLGGPMVTEEEKSLIDPYFHGQCTGSLCIPLKAGTINKIDGLEELRQDPEVLEISQYYHEGDTVKEESIGTLLQHLCRIKLTCSSPEAFKEKIDSIIKSIQVTNTNGEDQIYSRFNIERLD